MTQDEIQRIIHLNEIVVSDWPSAEDYSYKVRVEISSLFSRDVFRKELQARTVPAWMLNIRQDPRSKTELTLLFRTHGSEEPWQEAGAAVLQLADALAANPSAANVTLPITTWAQAPKLKLRVRLLSSLMLERTRGLRQVPRIWSSRPETFIAEQGEVAGRAHEPVKPPMVVALTEPEEVIIKDSWNKLLAWKELAVPMFYRRLTHKAQELGARFEPVAEGMAEQFFGLLDLCVRNLQPHTEHVLREAYRGVHPSPEFPCDTVEKYGRLFADMGMRPSHWRVFRDALIWVLPSVPYFEEYELSNLELGQDSAWYRFLNGHVVAPMLKAIERHDDSLDEGGLNSLKSVWDEAGDPRRLGLEFYRELFESSPDSMGHFRRVNPDQVVGHSFRSLESSVSGINDWRTLRGARQGVCQDAFFQSPLPAAGPAMTRVLHSGIEGMTPEAQDAWRALMSRSQTVWEQAGRRDHRMLRKATEYVSKVAKELGWDQGDLRGRLQEIGEEIAACGTYTHTYEEMCYGAQMAWRNASKCVGRLAWKQLMIRDLRHVNHPDDMFEELKEHLRAANNGGKVNPTVSLFRPMRPGEPWGPRIWNPQLIRYAAYRLSDGKIMGDPANLALTEAILNLGWTPPHPRTPWDILPVVIEVPGMQPSLYELPEDLVLRVHIKHPKYEQISHLGLQWYVIPAITNFRLEVGGISYGCCPFNGWYLVTEIGRDFTDDYRYDKLEAIAEAIGLDTSSIQTMWRDEAFLEINKAVLYSFQKNKMTIVDQHSASRQFLTHDIREKKAGRECPGQWSWVVPPLGGTTCPVYHHEMRDFFLEPQYYYHADKWAVETEAAFVESSWLSAEMTDESVNVLIFHASEDDSAEHMARMAGRTLQAFQPRVEAMADFDGHDLSDEPSVFLFIVSAFEDGELPAGTRAFLEQLGEKSDGELHSMAFSILVAGSSVYNDFMAVAEPLSRELVRLGGHRMLPTQSADGLMGQGAAFDQWLSLVGRILGNDATAAATEQESPEKHLAVREDAGIDVARPKPFRGHWAKVTGRDVVASSSGCETHRLVVDCSHSGLSYQVGDRLAVYPRQSAELVQRLCTRLGTTPDTVVAARYMGVFGEDLDDEPPFPSPITMADLLAGELALDWREPFPELLRVMLAGCGDQKESARLQDLLLAMERGDLEHKRTVRSQIGTLYPTVVHLLEAFPSVKLKIKTLVEVLAKVQPRFLTICSSAELEPGQIQAVFDLPAGDGDSGTEFLRSLRAGDDLRIDVRASSFRLPVDLSAGPLLLAGQGAGLGVLAGFLSELATKAQLGQSIPPIHVLVIGDPGPYGDQLQAWASRGILTSLSQGDSADEVLDAHKSSLVQVLRDGASHLYFSSETLVADALHDAMIGLLQHTGGLTYLDSVDVLEGVVSSGRLHRAVVPFTPGRTTLQQVREAKYSQGERWLRRYASINSVETAAAGG